VNEGGGGEGVPGPLAVHPETGEPTQLLVSQRSQRGSRDRGVLGIGLERAGAHQASRQGIADETL
jgi:hypothetical protein